MIDWTVALLVFGVLWLCTFAVCGALRLFRAIKENWGEEAHDYVVAGAFFGLLSLFCGFAYAS